MEQEEVASLFNKMRKNEIRNAPTVHSSSGIFERNTVEKYQLEKLLSEAIALFGNSCARKDERPDLRPELSSWFWNRVILYLDREVAHHRTKCDMLLMTESKSNTTTMNVANKTGGIQLEPILLDRLLALWDRAVLSERSMETTKVNSPVLRISKDVLVRATHICKEKRSEENQRYEIGTRKDFLTNEDFESSYKVIPHTKKVPEHFVNTNINTVPLERGDNGDDEDDDDDNYNDMEENVRGNGEEGNEMLYGEERVRNDGEKDEKDVFCHGGRQRGARPRKMLWIFSAFFVPFRFSPSLCSDSVDFCSDRNACKDSSATMETATFDIPARSAGVPCDYHAQQQAHWEFDSELAQGLYATYDTSHQPSTADANVQDVRQTSAEFRTTDELALGIWLPTAVLFPGNDIIQTYLRDEDFCEKHDFGMFPVFPKCKSLLRDIHAWACGGRAIHSSLSQHLARVKDALTVPSRRETLSELEKRDTSSPIIPPKCSDRNQSGMEMARTLVSGNNNKEERDASIALQERKDRAGVWNEHSVVVLTMGNVCSLSPALDLQKLYFRDRPAFICSLDSNQGALHAMEELRSGPLQDERFCILDNEAALLRVADISASERLILFRNGINARKLLPTESTLNYPRNRQSKFRVENIDQNRSHVSIIESVSARTLRPRIVIHLRENHEKIVRPLPPSPHLPKTCRRSDHNVYARKKRKLEDCNDDGNDKAKKELASNKSREQEEIHAVGPIWSEPCGSKKRARTAVKVKTAQKDREQTHMGAQSMNEDRRYSAARLIWDHGMLLWDWRHEFYYASTPGSRSHGLQLPSRFKRGSRIYAKIEFLDFFSLLSSSCGEPTLKRSTTRNNGTTSNCTFGMERRQRTKKTYSFGNNSAPKAITLSMTRDDFERRALPYMSLQTDFWEKSAMRMGTRGDEMKAALQFSDQKSIRDGNITGDGGGDDDDDNDDDDDDDDAYVFDFSEEKLALQIALWLSLQGMVSFDEEDSLYARFKNAQESKIPHYKGSDEKVPLVASGNYILDAATQANLAYDAAYHYLLERNSSFGERECHLIGRIVSSELFDADGILYCLRHPVFNVPWPTSAPEMLRMRRLFANQDALIAALFSRLSWESHICGIHESLFSLALRSKLSQPLPPSASFNFFTKMLRNAFETESLLSPHPRKKDLDDSIPILKRHVSSRADCDCQECADGRDKSTLDCLQQIARQVEALRHEMIALCELSIWPKDAALEAYHESSTLGTVVDKLRTLVDKLRNGPGCGVSGYKYYKDLRLALPFKTSDDGKHESGILANMEDPDVTGFQKAPHAFKEIVEMTSLYDNTLTVSASQETWSAQIGAAEARILPPPLSKYKETWEFLWSAFCLPNQRGSKLFPATFCARLSEQLARLSVKIYSLCIRDGEKVEDFVAMWTKNTLTDISSQNFMRNVVNGNRIYSNHSREKIETFFDPILNALAQIANLIYSAGIDKIAQ